jgi:hypothetical protein
MMMMIAEICLASVVVGERVIHTCSRMLKTSERAFSISSSSSTLYGCLVIASVICPPWSKPM